MSAVRTVPAAGMRQRKRGLIAVVLVLISLPVVLALVEAVSFYSTNRSNGTIVSSGVDREYLLHVPANYDRSKPTPLVITLHGASLWPAAQKQIDRWDRVADEHGFLVVYPSGLTGNGPRAWRAGREPGLTLDVQFIADLIDTLRASYNIDPARVYANGLSNGGGMAFALACKLSNRIAAIGVVSTAIFLPWNRCTDQRAVPMIAFQGTADGAIPYLGGTSWVAPDVFPSIPGWTARCTQRNGLAASPVESTIGADVTRIEYPNCATHSAVVLYRVEGGGHTWPGGARMPEWFAGTTTNSVSASGAMWEFFREHPLPAK